MTNPYLEALSKIPKGETRSFAEIAALAGRPSGARAAGRAVAACPSEAKVPWHRAVNAEGAFSIDPGRAALQLVRLRAERARPKDGESVTKWARRVHAAFVGTWKGRHFVALDDERAARFAPERVERFASASEAIARGFRPMDQLIERSMKSASSVESPKQSRRRRMSECESIDELEAALGQSAPRSPAPRRVRRVARRRAAKKSKEAPEPASASFEARLAALDWNAARQSLRDEGVFVAPGVLAPQECARIEALSAEDERFERTIEMGPRGYGIGRYRYWREPLPSPALELRARLYGELRALAAEAPAAVEYPRALEAFFERCRKSGQLRSSSILLAYPQGGVNHPHRDIYGAQWFPYQAVVVLSQRHVDFEGGEFELHEKRSDGSKRVRTFPLDQGDLCVFASRSYRPGGDRPGWNGRCVELEHGMSPVTRGERLALGIVLHLAE